MIELFEKYVDWKILAFFFRHPETQFHIKELSRALGVSPSSIHSAVIRFEQEGLLDKEVKGLAHLFKLKTNDMMVMSLKKGYGLAYVRSSSPEVTIKAAHDGVISIALYGSYANGAYDDKSDIDILVITSAKKQAYLDSTKKIEDILDTTVNLTIMKPSEWQKLAFNNDPFYKNVITNHVLLYGSGIALG